MTTKDIVKVTITRETTPIRRASFGIPLLLGANKVFIERAKAYVDLDSLLEDGFSITDAEYIAASKIFSQNPRVEEIVIGRRDVDKVVITVTEVRDDTDYFTLINDSLFSINSGAGATAITIAAAIVADINLGSEPVTATDNLDGTFDLDADVPGTPYTIELDVDLTATTPYTPSDTIINAITEIKAENNDWYMIVELLQDLSEVLELAAWVETENKLLGTTSSDKNIVDQDLLADTTSIAALLNSAEYNRTYVIFWNADYLKATDLGTNQYVDAAWDGVQLPKDPGSTNWAHKTFAGIQPLTLTTLQNKNATDKKANTFTLTGADGRTRFGTVASGEYIDIMRGIDWLQARLEEDVYTLLATHEKIPYTDSGIASVEAVVKAVLDEAVSAEFLEAGYEVTVPKIADVSPVDRAARILKGVTFKAVPAGAINVIEIDGEVSVF